MTTKPERYQPHIDGLRAVAVLAVLLFHLEVPGFAGGFVGVDVFLVISGFLITRLLRDEFEATGRIDFGRFYARRVRRLAPAMLAMVLATAVATVLLASASMLKRFGGEVSGALLCYSNINFWLEADYFDVSARLKPLLHTWSLSLEEQFYFVWPVLLFLAFRSRWRRWTPWMIFAVGIGSVALNTPFSKGTEFGEAHLLHAFDNGKSTIFFLLPFRVYEFAIGSLLVWVADRWRVPTQACELACVLGLCLIAWPVAQFDDQMLFPAHAALVPCSGAALLILAGGRARIGTLLSHKVMVGVGLISYSLYLVHWPAIVYWEYCAGELSIQSKLILAALSIALGYISYRWVEQPFRQTRPIWIVAPTFAFTLSAAVLMWLSDGWLWRIHPRPPYDIARGAAAFHLTYFGGVERRTFNTWGCGGPIDVLLMGDSHAEALMHGLDKHLRDAHSINVHAAPTGSFIHLPGFTRTTEGVDWDRQAKRSLDQAIATIRAQPVPPVLVLAHSWVSQMKRGASIDEDGRRRPGELSLNDVTDGIRRLKLLSGARVVLVVGQVPGSEVNCAEALERPRLSRSVSDQNLARSKRRHGFELFNRQMAQYAQDSGEFVFVDPFECVCEDETCENLTADGLPVYSDRNHLSVWGSDIIVRCFAPLVVEQVKGMRLVQEGHSPARLSIPPEAIATAGTGLFSVRLSDLGPPHHHLEWSFTAMKLIEDDDCLSPGGATDEEIRRGGGWRVDASGVLIFASPDGTDPRENGRSYEILYWQPTQTPEE